MLAPSAVATRTSRIWSTGFFENVPWLGIFCLFVTMLSMTASALVLATSNHTVVASWSVSPQVILAILSVFITSSLRLALSSGVAISWWYRVLKGAPLADTHRYWDFGTNLLSAATSWKHFNLISLATILVTLAMIEGPLMQKASSVSTRQISRPVSLVASIAPNLPSGYTAMATGEYRVPRMPTIEFSTAFNDYSTRAAFGSDGTFQGCPGTCHANIPGVGFQVDCESQNTSFSMEDYGPLVQKPQFVTNTSWSGCWQANCSETLIVNAGWAINTVPLAFANRVCTLSLAIVAYPLTFTNNITTLDLPLGQNPEVLTPLPPALTYAPSDSTTLRATLGGFYLLGNNDGETHGTFYANVSMGINGASSLYTLSGLNPFSWSHSVNMIWDVHQFAGYTWRDPTPDILAAYHEIMFRLAIQAATNSTLVAPVTVNGINYSSVMNVSAIHTFAENHYTTNFKYLAGALAVILLAILCVLRT